MRSQRGIWGTNRQKILQFSRVFEKNNLNLLRTVTLKTIFFKFFYDLEETDQFTHFMIKEKLIIGNKKLSVQSIIYRISLSIIF